MSQYNDYDEYDDGYYDEYDDYDGDDYGDTTQSKVVTKKQVKTTQQTNKNAKPPTSKTSAAKSTAQTNKSNTTTAQKSKPTTPDKSHITVSQSLNNLSINNTHNETNNNAVKRSTTVQDIAKTEKWYTERTKLIESTYHITQNNTQNNKLNIVVIGHVDAGKSTLMGHVLHLQGRIDNRTVQKYQKQSREQGKQSFAYAWILDSNDTERSRGVTTDIAINWFDTDKKHVTLLDAPGHRDFIPNMISGVAQAECALLIVPAVQGEYEVAFSDNGQTQEHAILARALGVQQIVVCVNKLDMCDYSEQRYNDIVTQVTNFLTTTAGFKSTDVLCIPISGLTGENIKQRSEPLLQWYTGPTLIELIDTQLHQTGRNYSRPLRMAISDLYKSQTLGYCVSGKIESGSIAANDNILVLPVNETITCKAVEVRSERVAVAIAGDTVDISINANNVDTALLAIGQWCCAIDSPIPLAQQFTAQILVMNTKQPILAGTQATMYTGITYYNVTINKLIAIVDKTSGETLKSQPRALPRLCSASVEITCQQAICIELYKNYRELGRFTLRRQSDTIAVGIVTDIIK